MKQNINCISALITLIFILSTFNTTAQIVKRTDFSGNWLINFQKSEFGEIPHYTASKQVKAVQTPGNIVVELLMVSASGADSIVNETLPLNGKALDTLGGDQRKRRVTAHFSEDGRTLTIITSASVPNDQKTEQYKITETWNISTTGESLVLKKTIQSTDGFEYSINAVYDKK
jgi:hypothetical protein